MSWSQRRKCKECSIYYTINPKQHEYPEEIRKLTIGNRVRFFIPFDYSAILPIVFYFLDVYQTDIYLLGCVFMTFLVIAAILLLLEKFEM